MHQAKRKIQIAIIQRSTPLMERSYQVLSSSSQKWFKMARPKTQRERPRKNQAIPSRAKIQVESQRCHQLANRVRRFRKNCRSRQWRPKMKKVQARRTKGHTNEVAPVNANNFGAFKRCIMSHEQIHVPNRYRMHWLYTKLIETPK